jgi:hypothetical protein
LLIKEFRQAKSFTSLFHETFPQGVRLTHGAKAESRTLTGEYFMNGQSPQQTEQPLGKCSAVNPPSSPESILKRAEGQVKYRTSILKLSQEDQEDLRQEMRLALLQAAPRFDPDKGNLDTFIDRILRQSIGDAMRQAELEEQLPLESLDLLEVGLEPTVNEVHQGELDEVGHIDLQLDIQGILSSLPEDIQTIGFALLTDSPSEIRRRFGHSRNFMSKAITLIREALHEAGLEPEGKIFQTTYEPQPDVISRGARDEDANETGACHE